MKPTNASKESKTGNKKQWKSPELSELPVKDTHQLEPPEPQPS